MDFLEHYKQYVAELIQALEAEKTKSKSYLSIFCVNKQKAHRKCPIIKKTWSKIFKAERKLLDMLIYRKMSLKIKNVDTLVSDLPRNTGKIYQKYLNCPLKNPGPNALENIILLHKMINQNYQTLVDIINIQI